MKAVSSFGDWDEEHQYDDVTLWGYNFPYIYSRWNVILFVNMFLVSNTLVNIFVHNIHTNILDSYLLHFYLGEFFEGMIEPTAARWPVLGFKCVLFLMMRTAMPCEVGYPSKWSIELQHERHTWHTVLRLTAKISWNCTHSKQLHDMQAFVRSPAWQEQNSWLLEDEPPWTP